MFERLFRLPWALEPHLNGPLAEERRRFLCHRAEQGYGHRGLRMLPITCSPAPLLSAR